MRAGELGERDGDPEQQLVPRNHIQPYLSRSLVMTTIVALQKEVAGTGGVGGRMGGQGGKEREKQKKERRKEERVFESLYCSPARWTI